MRSLTIVCATWKPEIRGTISQKAPFLATWQDESSIKIDWTTRFWQYCGTLKKILFSKSEKSDNSMRHLETRNPGHYFTESPFSCYLTRWILDKNWLNHAILAILWYIEENTIFQKWEVWQDESSILWTTRFWQYCGTLKKILFSKSEKSDNSMRHWKPEIRGTISQKAPFLATWQDESLIKIDWTTRFWQYCGTLKKILFSKSEKSDNSMRHLETRNPGHYFTESPFSCYLTRWILDKNWLNHAILAILWYIEENTIFQKWEVWQ